MIEPPEKPNRNRAIAAGVTMIAITAIQFVAARFSLRDHLTSVDIASLRFVGASAIFLPIIWKTGVEKLKALGWQRAATLAVLVGLPYPTIINTGLTYAPAAHAAALCPASIVFFSFLLSRVVFKETIQLARIIGIVTIIAGLLLFISPVGNDTGNVLYGDLLFVGSGVMFSTYAILIRQWAVDPITATAAVVLLSCLPLPIVHVLVKSGLGAATATEIIAQLVIQGFLAGAASMLLYTYVVRQLGPQIASLFLPSVPIATTAVAMLVLGEVPTSRQFGAMLIMTVGMIYPALQRQPARPRADPAAGTATEHRAPEKW
ncbi:MAG TPA: DMT family transporter [Steroidobacteraceae bacterium]|nr:DMT family transporter [Steroidobacteraceae bacterium]